MGSFVGRANWNVRGSNASLQARSSLDLKAFLDAFGLSEPVASIDFQAPPAGRGFRLRKFWGRPLQAEHHRTPCFWPVRLQESSIFRSHG